MSDVKFAAARELILEKRYDEARAILETINNEKALLWLRKLDELEGPRSPNGSGERTVGYQYGGAYRYDSGPSRTAHIILWTLVTLMFAAAVIAVVAVALTR